MKFMTDLEIETAATETLQCTVCRRGEQNAERILVEAGKLASVNKQNRESKGTESGNGQ